MRIVLQRVKRASVEVEGRCVSKIGCGYLLLLGVSTTDTPADAEWLAHKVATLRLMEDGTGAMNNSIVDAQGEILVVSQFTLFASCKKGTRPSWQRAAGRETAIPLYETFCQKLSAETGRQVATGEFGANMQVELLNDGPVTILLDSQNRE